MSAIRNDNEIIIEFDDNKVCETPPLYQYDKGIVLRFTDVPDTVDVQFSNIFTKETLNKTIHNSVVKIPDSLLEQLSIIAGYIRYINEDSEWTEKVLSIPVLQREKPSDYIAEEDKQTFREEMQAIMEETKKIAENRELTEEEMQKIIENIDELNKYVSTTRTIADENLEADITKNTFGKMITETFVEGGSFSDVLVSYLQSHCGSYEQEYKNKKEIEKINEELLKKEKLIGMESGYNILNPQKLKANKGLDRITGAINNSATAFNLYEKLEIDGGLKYVVQRKVPNKSFNVIICFYDENETFISSIVFTSGAKEQKWMDFTSPVNAKYLSMAYRHLNGTEVVDWTEIMLSNRSKFQTYRPYETIARNMIVDSYEKFERSFDEFNMNKSSLGMFRRIGVLGDSMSVGYLFDKDNNVGSYRNLEYSWVQQLARTYGNTFTNFGNSGIACSGWFTGTQYGNVEVVKEGNKCQAYIIGLGINDSISNTYLVGGTSDIGTDNGTFIANYSKIVESVKAVNEDAKIFIMTLPLHSPTRDVKNVAIKKIAEYYKGQNVYLVDLAGEYFDVINKASVNNYASGNHFSAGGYKNLALINGAIISDVIDNNAIDFWNVHLIPYDEVESAQIYTIGDGLKLEDGVLSVNIPRAEGVGF